MATTSLTADTYDQVVDDNEIVFVKFAAEWCPPCRRFTPVFEAASERHRDVMFGTVDTDAEPALAKEAGITSIPTILAYREGILLFGQRGEMPADKLDELIDAVRDLDMEQVRAFATPL